MGAEHSRPLDQLRGEDERLFGGKSAGLGELIGSQIPVPPGFALSVTAFQAFLGGAGLEERIAQELSGLDPANVEAVRVASTAIVDAVRAEPLPEAIAAEVAQRYSELAAPDGEADPPVAVRSSALGEDSAEAAFAGQQETYLWVRGAAGVCTALRDCWASLYSPEAISYRAQMAAEQSPAMGVAVQRMVDAAVSGVTFTCNPVNGDPSTVAVNASWGLGLAVVGGEVTPDEYRVSKVTGEVLQRTVGPKQVEYLPDPAGGGTVRAQVPAERQQEPCLDEEQLGVLVDLGRRIERHFGSHQDIEWAIARVGALPESLFVLQSRPVTTSPRKDAGATRRQSAMALVMDTFGAARDAPDR